MNKYDKFLQFIFERFEMKVEELSIVFKNFVKNYNIRKISLKIDILLIV